MMIKNTLKAVVVLGLVCLVNSCLDTRRKVYNDPTEGVLLMGPTIHFGNGEVMENANLVVRDDLITVLSDSLPEDTDLSLYQVETLGRNFHVYPFNQVEQGNSGIVLARASGGNININIRINEEAPVIQKGKRAMLLICRGTIQDAAKFQVEYVMIGSEKVKIQKQGSYSTLSGGG